MYPPDDVRTRLAAIAPGRSRPPAGIPPASAAGAPSFPRRDTPGNRRPPLRQLRIQRLPRPDPPPRGNRSRRRALRGNMAPAAARLRWSPATPRRTHRAKRPWPDGRVPKRRCFSPAATRRTPRRCRHFSQWVNAPGGGVRFLLDKLCHASLIDAVGATGCPFRVFPHNHLAKLGTAARGVRPRRDCRWW